MSVALALTLMLQAEHNLGLIDREYPTDKKFDPNGSKPQWQRFGYWLSYLNSKCNKDDNTKFKLLVLGRHGQGYHNVAESYYGTPAWNVSCPLTIVANMPLIYFY